MTDIRIYGYKNIYYPGSFEKLYLGDIRRAMATIGEFFILL